MQSRETVCHQLCKLHYFHLRYLLLKIKTHLFNYQGCSASEDILRASNKGIHCSSSRRSSRSRGRCGSGGGGGSGDVVVVVVVEAV